MMRWVCFAAAAELRSNEELNAAGASPLLPGGPYDVSLDTVLQYLQAEGPVDHALCGADYAQANAARVMDTLAEFPHARLVPAAVLLEYVAPFTVLDEPRITSRIKNKCDQWWAAPDFARLKQQPEVQAMRKNLVASRDVAAYVAESLQGLLGLHFRADLTPNFMSVEDILNSPAREASCTGLSIMFVDALRSLGVPARVAGTPAWNGKDPPQNHDWVEAYVCSKSDGTDCEWEFFDALSPLESPCKNWFCNHAKLGSASGTKVFASHFARGGAGEAFPLAWAPDKQPGSGGVYGEDRTAAYAKMCGACPRAETFLQRARSVATADLAAARDRVSAAVAGIERDLQEAAVSAAVDVGAGHV